MRLFATALKCCLLVFHMSTELQISMRKYIHTHISSVESQDQRSFITPSMAATQDRFSGITVYIMSFNSLSSLFFSVFIDGALTTLSGNLFHGAITLYVKNCLRISFTAALTFKCCECPRIKWSVRSLFTKNLSQLISSFPFRSFQT